MAGTFVSRDASFGEPLQHLSHGAVALLIFVSVICFFAYFLIQYTYCYVVATLAIVESPTTSVESPTTNVESPTTNVESPTTNKTSPPPYTSEAAPLLGNVGRVPLADEEHQAPASPPITSSLWRARRHLRSIGGLYSWFRGLGIYILLNVLVGVLSTLIGLLVPNVLFKSFVSIIVFTSLTGLYVLWVHVVISVPSSKNWYQRFVNYSQVKRIMVPMAFYALSAQLVWLVPYALGFLLGMYKYGNEDKKYELDARCLVLVLCGIFVAVFVLFPTNVILVRVAASVLPEEEATILPFDRTFGGRVAPGERLKMWDAWKSFTWEAIKRVIKIYVKAFLLQAMIAALWGAAVSAIFSFGKKN